MEDNNNFDALARRANETGALTDSGELFREVFILPELFFILPGENFNADFTDSDVKPVLDKEIIRAFTAAERLMRFARENSLSEADGTCRIVKVPTANAIEYLQSFREKGAYGVSFNSDSESEDFFILIDLLPTVKGFVDSLNPTPQAAPKTEIKTAILIVQDGLGFPSGFVTEASYKLNIFCRVPTDWTDGERLKINTLEKIFEFLYGANWRNGNDDGSRYMVIDSFSRVYDDETVKKTRWEGIRNTDDVHYRFYLANADGTIRAVTDAEFQAEIEAESH